jgi:uncharacterized membrane protein YphA (DoxX/SURF4 family)
VDSGWKAMKDPAKLAPRAKRLTEQVGPTLQKVHPKIPTDTESLIRLNGAVHVVGGIAMLTPARRLAAATLAATLVPTTLAGHAYWEFENPADRAQQRIHFLKNLGLLGGLIITAMDTEGQPSLSWRARHAADAAERSVRRAARNTKSKTTIARRSASLGRHIPA